MHKLIFTLLLTCILGFLSYGELNAITKKQTPVYKMTNFEKKVITLVNVERRKRKLHPLKIHINVSKVARERSKDMYINQYFSHYSPVYGIFSNMLRQKNIFFRLAGENIAKSTTPKNVMNLWMKSPGHRHNILSPHYTHIGVGRKQGGHYGSYWTQIFISR